MNKQPNIIRYCIREFESREYVYYSVNDVADFLKIHDVEDFYLHFMNFIFEKAKRKSVLSIPYVTGEDGDEFVIECAFAYDSNMHSVESQWHKIIESGVLSSIANRSSNIHHVRNIEFRDLDTALAL